MELIGFLVLIGVILYGGFHVYMIFVRPDLWAQMQQRKHERELARLAHEEAKRKAASSGLLADVAKAVIAAAIKGKPHN